jgi:hypothetical protein
MVAFSVGSIVGIGEMNSRMPDRQLEAAAFGVALAAWLPYWFVSTE